MFFDACVAIVFTSTSTLVYGHTCIKEHCYWFIRVQHLGEADEVHRDTDAKDL
jgi:hypothetical protein